LLRYLLEAVHRQKRDRKKAERAALRALQEMVLGLDSPDNPLRRYADQIFALQVEQREIQSVPKEGNQTHLSQDRDP
ncbi:MAG: hypothetical protein HY681_09405, partial [Chloroflexi bacterium]|nr:hypothetical protein [Chloroflexota bacterium]